MYYTKLFLFSSVELKPKGPLEEGLICFKGSSVLSSTVKDRESYDK